MKFIWENREYKGLTEGLAEELASIS